MNQRPAQAKELTDEELQALPIFPLPRTVLLPGALLPLHIFEPRYRDLVRDCLEQGPQAMTIAMLKPGYEARYQHRPPIVSVAGAGRIVAHRENRDGTYDLLLQGVSRVQLDELPAEGRTYRRARASVLEEYEYDPDAPSLRSMLDSVRATLSTVAMMELQQNRASTPLELGHDPGRIADAITIRYLREPSVQQRVLETLDVAQRVRLVGEELVSLLATLSSTEEGSNGAVN